MSKIDLKSKLNQNESILIPDFWRFPARIAKWKPASFPFFFALNIQAFSLFQLYLDPGYGTAVGISSLAHTAEAARDDPVDVKIKITDQSKYSISPPNLIHSPPKERGC